MEGEGLGEMEIKREGRVLQSVFTFFSFLSVSSGSSSTITTFSSVFSVQN